MTIRQFCEKYCTDRGMWPSQATATVKAMESAMEFETGKPMEGRWDDDTSGYPEPLLALLVHRLRKVALEYIDRECPLVFFRPLFVDDPTEPAAVPPLGNNR